MHLKSFIIASIVLTCMMVSIYAAPYVDVNANGRVDVETNGINTSSGIGQNLSVAIGEKRTEYRQGNFTTSLGQYLSVNEMVAGMLELREGGVVVKTKLNLTKVEKDKDKKLEVRLSNGRNVQIKVMPSTASEVALERLRVNVCSTDNNCTIELKEVGSGSDSKVAYEVQIERHSRILGIFQKKMRVSAQVDAETGVVIKEHKPWWAFIATEAQAESE